MSVKNCQGDVRGSHRVEMGQLASVHWRASHPQLHCRRDHTNPGCSCLMPRLVQRRYLLCCLCHLRVRLSRLLRRLLSPTTVFSNCSKDALPQPGHEAASALASRRTPSINMKQCLQYMSRTHAKHQWHQLGRLSRLLRRLLSPTTVFSNCSRDALPQPGHEAASALASCRTPSINMKQWLQYVSRTHASHQWHQLGRLSRLLCRLLSSPTVFSNCSRDALPQPGHKTASALASCRAPSINMKQWQECVSRTHATHQWHQLGRLSRLLRRLLSPTTVFSNCSRDALPQPGHEAASALASCRTPSINMKQCLQYVSRTHATHQWHQLGRLSQLLRRLLSPTTVFSNCSTDALPQPGHEAASELASCRAPSINMKQWQECVSRTHATHKWHQLGRLSHFLRRLLSPTTVFSNCSTDALPQPGHEAASCRAPSINIKQWLECVSRTHATHQWHQLGRLSRLLRRLLSPTTVFSNCSTDALPQPGHEAASALASCRAPSINMKQWQECVSRTHATHQWYQLGRLSRLLRRLLSPPLCLATAAQTLFRNQGMKQILNWHHAGVLAST